MSLSANLHVYIDEVQMPGILNEIVGREITVNIEITEENVNADSNIYEAADIRDSSTPSSSFA